MGLRNDLGDRTARLTLAFIAASVILLLPTTDSVQAQGKRDVFLYGTVSHDSGAGRAKPVHGAEVILRKPTSGNKPGPIVSSAVTNAKGRYLLYAPPSAGDYELAARYGRGGQLVSKKEPVRYTGKADAKPIRKNLSLTKR